MIDYMLQAGSVLGAAGCIVFLAIYHRSARWWIHPYGRALFALVAVSMLFYLLSTLSSFLGLAYWGRLPLRIVAQFVSPLIIWYLVVALVRVSATARRERRMVEESYEGEEIREN